MTVHAELVKILENFLVDFHVTNGFQRFLVDSFTPPLGFLPAAAVAGPPVGWLRFS